jgi:O-methyltransferase involved in polyketide biosynthesis
MKDRQSSITALGIAIVRAVESEKPEGARIRYDPNARQLLNPLFYRFIHPFIDAGYIERSRSSVQGFVVARYR